MGHSKSSTYFTHSPLPSLPSYQFLCSTWNPVSSPRPTRVGGRRAQGLSRSAVAVAWPHAPSFPGRALTAPVRMIEDMSIRKFAGKTQHDYVQRIKEFATFLGRSPDAAKSDDVRRFRLHLTSSGAGTPTMRAFLEEDSA